ncbi:PDZ domain-containing protein [Ensifer adhaerens]|uniref:S41 family peptidase n=1 Tax=Ensifer adhaerens TaxID=106592 RepID=UPI001CBD1AB7|nr:S41 family peptidase [Ensifer adhaerens]MBZ7925671.1 PDZ domain-containing protein [Ensifer adhaerens]UAX95189.1 PDZ domain-containing protein [Ensifer adhaerens]UAY02920.1 PDZ domain-containing protein [Ensifer adhaerens]UAY10904.1 PDZ domain-containing protein [Ensifer adhaerens]
MPSGLSAVALSLSLLLAASAVSHADDLPRSGQPVFDRVVELVNANFYDGKALDRFNAAVRSKLDPGNRPISLTSPVADVDDAITSVLSSLSVSHTGRYKPDMIDYFELSDIFRFAIRDDIRRLFPPDGEVRYPGIGMVTTVENGHRFVVDVYDGSPAKKAGLLVGDEILAVDGDPYREIGSFDGKVGSSVDIRLQRERGAAPMSIRVPVEQLRPLPMFERAIDESVTLSERAGHRIGYVRMWTLSTRHGLDIVADALANGALKDAEGLVVDLRGRWGGGPADAAELFVGDTPSFRLIPRKGEATLANFRWRKPVIALIDKGTRSGLELFAYALRQNAIPLVGERTAGALLAGRAYVLPDDSLLELAVSDAVIDNDLRLEGIGIEPDISVASPIAYAAGKDPQREAGFVEMARMLAAGKSGQAATPRDPAFTR